MAASITYLVDPVVKGAIEIQSTIFDLKVEDYDDSTWEDCKSAQMTVGLKAKYFPGSPQGGWMYYRRNDIAELQILAIQTIRLSDQVNMWSATVARQVTLPFSIGDFMVYNWYPVVLGLSDGTTVKLLLCNRMSIQLLQNPEDQTFFIDNGVYKHQVEANGFLFNQLAAAYPATTRLALLAAANRPI